MSGGAGQPGPIVVPFRGVAPRIDAAAFVAPGASIVGDVEIGADASIWFGCAVRGDVNVVRIGAGSNLQDGSVIHVTSGGGGTHIGAKVTVGHMVLLHDCRLEDSCFVGMNACIMDGAVVESHGMVAAGALVTPGKRVRSGELWAGRPARFMRGLTEFERSEIDRIGKLYIDLGREYRRAASGPPPNG